MNIRKLGIAVLLGGAAILFYACENADLEQIKVFSSPENQPVVEARNFESLLTDSGQIRFFIKAPKLLKFENEGKNDYVEFPEGIELVKYDDKENVISRITANYARQYEKQKKWEAKNNVVAFNAKGDTLKTELLIWEEKTEKIYTDEYVKIIRPDQIITGIGFESDQNLDNWKIKNPKGTIYVSVEDNKDTKSEGTQKSSPE
ncbi:MAG TPA: LPS export ABC transporter periplasmic protein LptC, partial [Draconibacterium sp.]|nr:LPS export ABC transporter periplasmic protein LptC [Draconibacterium sp.]